MMGLEEGGRKRITAMGYLVGLPSYLKSGCHLEKLQLETAERLERALATSCIVAWRLLYLTYLARKNPDASCEGAFQTHEWQALSAFTYQTNMLPATPPSRPRSYAFGSQTWWFPRSQK